MQIHMPAWFRLGDDVLDGLLQSIDEAEQHYAALVIWQTEPPFSVGANLKKTPPGGKESKPGSSGKGAPLNDASSITEASQLLRDTADEIERLRAEIARYRTGLQKIIDADGWWDAPSLARDLLDGKDVK